MEKRKSHCEVCETEIEVRMCCNQPDCGCMGMPIDPPVCSSECYDKLMEQHRPKSDNFTITKTKKHERSENTFNGRCS